MMVAAHRQLPLAIRLADEYSFGTFRVGGNGTLLELLRDDAQRFVYLWGEPGSGRTHLLQAACRRAGEHGRRSMYLSLTDWRGEGPGVLDGLEALDLICIDELESVADAEDWQEALFHLYNRVREGSGRLLFAAAGAPRELGLQLHDFVTRLGQCVVVQVQALDGDQSLAAFRDRAALRGMSVRDDVLEYLGHRHPRDLPALMATLDRIDAETLRQQRRVTIPFLRELMGW